VLPGRFISHETSLADAMFRWYFPKSRWRRFVDALGFEKLPIDFLPNEAFLCLDCGMVWTSIDPTNASSQVSAWGDESLKTRLGYAKAPIPKDDEITSLYE
jgi:hypothetical protein